ncbi:MAG TPA: amidohydrolase family protein [Pyrinomonadaceae bacterium]|nr:amidohydrolase family protein [Pyrinomonadaceae bacterium]
MRNPYTRLARGVSRALLFTFCAAQVLPLVASAQTQTRGIDTYAITNARIVPVSGPVIARGTVVIRDGLIEAVGAGASAPADARIIDGTGLTVYPGLIDANTSLGIPQATPSMPRAGSAAAGSSQSGSTNFTSPNSTQPPGLQPELLAADQIRAGGEQIESTRSAGITAALTSPREGILIGQSAFINLAGDTPQQMIVRSPVALHVGFTPLRTGGYPASLMGVFSALRQMLLDAGRYAEAQSIYERSPRGLRRPEQDKSLAALVPVIRREMPVVMYANTEREITRALELAKEFNLRAIIAGGEESWRVAARLRESGVPVLLSLNFPKRTTAAVPEADPDPLRILRARVDAPKTAGRLAAASVPFAFQSGSLPTMADFLTNVAKAVENGLQRDEALRAMTLRPAEILGVSDRLGSIEVGKIANLTVTRGDILDRNTRISYVFIDGRPVDLKPVTPTGAGNIAAGTWTLSVDLGEGAQAVTLVLQQEGETLRGSMQGALGSAQIANASVGSGGDIRFSAPVNVGGLTTEATFTGTITGNEMRGTVTVVGRSPGTFTGTRPAGPPPATTTPPRTNTPPATSPTPPAQEGSRTVSVELNVVPNLSGTWTINFDVGGQTVPGTLRISQLVDQLSGTIQSPVGRSEFSKGSVGAEGFRFTTTEIVDGRTVEMIVTGEARGNTMRGTVTSALGTMTFTGRKP